MRAGFVVEEITTGLRRNLTMTIAVVVTVAISLSLLGVGLLIREQVQTMKGYWYDRIEVSVFLCGAATSARCPTPVTDDQRELVRQQLEALPQVEEVFYESQDVAYERFREQFEDTPDLVRNVDPSSLPESYRVKLEDPSQFAVVAAAVQDAPGVEDVVDQRRLLGGFFRLLRGVQVAALAVAVAQVLAAVLLISNTIRVAAFSRRRETGIMRLVGASAFYIQLPFLLEGAIAGLLGALLATGVVVGVKAVVIDRVLRPEVQAVPFLGWDSVLAVVPLLLVVGVGVAALASFLTLRRHLRV